MSKLFLFPTPTDAHCALRLDDTGQILTAIPDTHPTGRLGQSITLPAATPDQHGAGLTITATGKVPLSVRGILFLHTAVGLAGLEVDDFHLVDAAVSLPRLVVSGTNFAMDVQP